MTTRPLIVAACACLLTASCGDRERLGDALDTSGFTAATVNNIAVQTGRIGQIEGLNDRFSTEVDSIVNFAFNSAILSPEAQAAVARQAAWIRQFPEATFRVFGHTDLVGAPAYNQALGQRRAEAVVDALVANGISRTRLAALVSFGETRPLIVTQGRERANRRTVTEVSGFVGGESRLLNGKYAEVIFREYVESAVPPSDTSGGGLEAISAASE